MDDSINTQNPVKQTKPWANEFNTKRNDDANIKLRFLLTCVLFSAASQETLISFGLVPTAETLVGASGSERTIQKKSHISQKDLFFLNLIYPQRHPKKHNTKRLLSVTSIGSLSVFSTVPATGTIFTS